MIGTLEQNIPKIWLWFTLNAMDVAVTWLCIAQGHSEGNPIISALGTSISFIIYKVVLSLLVVGLLAKGNGLHLLRWLNIAMALIVTWGVICLVS